MSAQWEYKVIRYKLRLKGFDYDQLERDLNELGRDGWDAISTIAPSYGQGQAIEIAVILKKPHD
jgi:hypothetical protein